MNIATPSAGKTTHPADACAKLNHLADELEQAAYALAGQLEALTVARLILMSHEVSQISDSLNQKTD